MNIFKDSDSRNALLLTAKAVSKISISRMRLCRTVVGLSLVVGGVAGGAGVACIIIGSLFGGD